MNYENMLIFLDCAIQATRKHIESITTVNEKCIYHHHAEKLAEARRTLLKEVFAYEDYVKTGKYEVPTIKFSTITIPVKSIH